MSSAATMWLCHICDKPFTKESSHKRHISYCRRNQTRPRARRKSCRSCNASKVKCSFQAPCRRCLVKGLNCVYELPKKSVASVQDSDVTPSIVNEQSVIDLSDIATSLQSCNSSSIDVLNEDRVGVTDSFDLPNTGDMDDIFMDLLPLHVDEPFGHGYDASYGISTLTPDPANEAVPFDMWAAWPYDSIQPRMGHAAQAPWSAWITSVENHPALRNPNLNDVFRHTQAKCLTILQPSSEVVQHTTRLGVQAMRAYPMMMLRRETLPPFIHPHWHRQSTPALPEPLSNCMSIAQMYAFRSEETKPFIWRTVKAEDERFLAQRLSLSVEDLLAALQAQMIYMIMRFVDGASEPVELNQQLVVTYQLLCKRFRKICGGIFCEVDQVSPRPSWEDWIFAESRRRTACLFFLICHCVSVEIPGCVTEGFGGLPLSSPKTLWEAKTRADWELEYSAYSARQETTMRTIDMLIEAHKRDNDPVQSHLLDEWNGSADNLGNLLSIAASMCGQCD